MIVQTTSFCLDGDERLAWLGSHSVPLAERERGGRGERESERESEREGRETGGRRGREGTKERVSVWGGGGVVKEGQGITN